MKRLKRVLVVRKQDHDESFPFSVEHFESVAEALEYLGEEVALRILNYHFELQERQRARAEAARNL